MNKKSLFQIFAILFIVLTTSSQTQLNLWGVTAENANDEVNISALVQSLKQLPGNTSIIPACRIVLHPDENNPYTPNPGDYDASVQSLAGVSKVMAEILDSYYWAFPEWQSCDFPGYEFTQRRVLNRLNDFMINSSMARYVDIWEVANEVNAPWVNEGKTGETGAIVSQMLQNVKSNSNLASNKTAITLYFYPSVNCVDECQGNPEPNESYMPLTWATNCIEANPDVIYNLDYVFISFYAEDLTWCDYDPIDWDAVFTQLNQLFPYSKIGFGEIGSYGSTNDKIAVINEFYGLRPNLTGDSFFSRACFYWTYMDDCVPYQNNPVWEAIYNNIQYYGPNGSPLKTSKEKINPYGFLLHQNYPNPFNPSTVIKYSLPKASETRLTVFDASGREVCVLFSGSQEAGTYEVTFDAKGFASGIYYYKLVADGYSNVKKMALVK